MTVPTPAEPTVQPNIEPASQPAVEPPTVALIDLGTCDYRKAWERQKELVRSLTEDGKGRARSTLLVVEHPHVYTLGRRGKGGANLVAPGEVPVIEVERGGDVTYHGPGQLVAYPVLRLAPAWQDVRRYVGALQWALIDTLATFDIQAGLRRGEPGAWVVQDGAERLQEVPELDEQLSLPNNRQASDELNDPLSPSHQPPPPPATPIADPLPDGCRWRKVASVGVALSRWVTYHGVALNVSTDLSYFGRINPCGFDSATMTSMSELLGRTIEVDEVKPVLVEALENNLCVKITVT